MYGNLGPVARLSLIVGNITRILGGKGVAWVEVDEIIPSKAMMIRRRSLMSSSRSVFVDIIVAVAIVVSTRTILTVQAFSSPSSARYVVGSSALAGRHHRSLLPSSSISTLSSSILSRRVHGISSTTTQYRRNHHAKATVSTTTCHASSSAAATILNHGISTFMSNWKSYGLIPLVAGFVGWFTNYLAVQMIFYPIKWRGLPIYKVEGEPLGLLGWQGEFF